MSHRVEDELQAMGKMYQYNFCANQFSSDAATAAVTCAC